MKKIFEFLGTVVIAFAIAMFLKSTVFAIPEIRMNSMENTLIQGERVLEIKFIYDLTAPKRGEVIILDKDNASKGFFLDYADEIKETIDVIRGKAGRNHLIKRIIGLPGDEIKIEEGQVYINDELLEEAYVKGETYADALEFPLIVPEGKVFVMGDNREVSLDSRQLGFIDYKQIEGKAVARIWPLDKLKIIKK
ncbi:signal peptidase I [Lutispora sp.]|jgi:signal peptidase I|uniref:signal peptidase I n=1 Tax=Lutispora sp. TaxID=2828727 RepID=UPI002B1E91FD|nr:signal peptidase I [Lutispora sp.]MEA4962515.1 signal peptidase I [Lutispora sp.]